MDEKNLLRDADIEEFREVCRPVVEWLQTKRDNMETVIITVDYCKVVVDGIGVAFALPEDY